MPPRRAVWMAVSVSILMLGGASLTHVGTAVAPAESSGGSNTSPTFGFQFGVDPNGPVVLPLAHELPADLLGSDWPTYLGEVTRNSANAGETELSPSNATNLGLLWSYAAQKRIESSPAIVNGTVYIGSIDGSEYALNASTGALEWRSFLGLSTPNNCSGAVGSVSSATESDGTVYVGGGDGYWDALNSSTGHIDWHFYIGNSSKGYYNWASPLIVNGYAYIGVSSQCDSPLVPGGLWQVSLSTHAGVFFPTTPKGTIGSSIWGSPSYDASTNTVFAATGNPNGLTPTPDSESILAWNATTMALLGKWQVPRNQTGIDADFGTTPDLLTLANGAPLVVATNKNGITYALNSSDLGAGPVWETPISFLVKCPSSHCAAQPPNVAPVAYGDGLLYAGGAKTTILGVNYSGSIRALYPSNGTAKWVNPESADVLGAPAYANGILVAAVGDQIQVLNATTGALLWSYTALNPCVSAPAIARGVIYVGCTDAEIYAFTTSTHSLKVMASPTQGPVGSTVNVSGTGFTGSTKLTSLVFDGVTITTCAAGSLTANATGAFSCTFSVPSGTSGTTIKATDASSKTAVGSFTVTTPKISVSPTKGPLGATVTVAGTGFSISTMLKSLVFDSKPIPSCTSGSLSVGGTGAFSCTFKVPSGTSGTAVTATDVGGKTATGKFTPTTPKITVSPTKGAVGSTVTVSGTGFSVLTKLKSLVFDGVTLTTCTKGSLTTSATGAFSCTFKVPKGTSGMTVKVTDVGGQAASAKFTVT